MHSYTVLVQCLRVNGLKREWWLDLPELSSIRLGYNAFRFKNDDSSELIMRSDDDKGKWWIDLSILTTLTTDKHRVFGSETFRYPHSITLEGVSHHSILINRHALSHHCYPWQGKCFQIQGNRSHQESSSSSSLIPRHLSRSFWLPLLSSFFHTPLFQTIHPTPY